MEQFNYLEREALRMFFKDYQRMTGKRWIDRATFKKLALSDLGKKYSIGLFLLE